MQPENIIAQHLPIDGSNNDKLQNKGENSHCLSSDRLNKSNEKKTVWQIVDFGQQVNTYQCNMQ